MLHHPRAIERASREAFEAWLGTPSGSGVARAFVALALELRRRGWRHFGGQAVLEHLRFESALRDGPGTLVKLDNSHVAYLVRLAMDEHEELRGFFEVRRSAADVR